MNNYKPFSNKDLDVVYQGLLAGFDSYILSTLEQLRRANRLSEALLRYYRRDSRDEIPGSPVEMKKRKELQDAHNAYLGVSQL